MVSWSDLNTFEQAKMIAYEQIRQIEENKQLEYVALAGVKKTI